MLITEYYANQEIFVTGGTGFLGKALIEKLLRDCPKIKTIYMLMRGNKKQNANERFEDYKKNNVFDRIHQECPHVLNKLYAIEGDSKDLRLGISDTDLELLKNVGIIFHMAANIKFNDALRSAIILNARGTYELIKIAETLKNLTCFMHCSTAYCNPLLTTVEEKIYSTPVDWRTTLKLAETYDEDILNTLCQKYTGNFPNTYTFTKNLCEHIIQDYSSKLPMFLFRPSIVLNAISEPFPGWIDNINGVLSAVLAASIGIIPLLLCVPEVKMVYVPIDVVTKLTIVAAYKRGLQKLRNVPIENGLEVVNCGCKEFSSLSLKMNNKLFTITEAKNPLENCVWKFGGIRTTSSYYLFYFYLCLINVPMSLLLDSVLRVMGKKPMGLKLTRHILFFADSVNFFTSKSFDVRNSNMLNLETSIPDTELATFGSIKECSNVNFIDYYAVSLRGLKAYVFNHPVQATEGAHLRRKILVVPNFDASNMLITEFYANKDIFITGGTGFLGQALIEKLLRDCPKIKTIYMLMRANKKQNASERFEDFKKKNVFERIHKECPDVFIKIHVIEGDSKEIRLGIKDKDLELLQNVSMIFHMAANVKFNEPLRNALLLNARGTHELIKIAETLKHLTCFMHCSTAYCNPFLTTVEEKIYSAPVDWRKALKIAETYDEETINILCLKYTGHFPNTYTFTKNITEHIIKDYSSKLPMFIFRPAVVINAVREPVSGWIDNVNGTLAASLAIAVGIIPIALCKKDVRLIYVPIDVVTKLTIVAAYKRSLQKLRNEIIENGLEVVNCASEEFSSLTFETCDKVYDYTLKKNPLENCVWKFSGKRITESYALFYFYLCLINVPVSLVLDSVLRVMGKKPMGMKLTRFILFFADSVDFFSNKTFDMKTKNMLNLENSIPECELDTFGTVKDCTIVHYFKYADDMLCGIKKNVFNHAPKATDAAHLRRKILIILNNTIKFIVYGLIFRYLWLKIY